MRPEQSNVDLERRYRRLLRAFPRGYREHRGEEMLATLLETAKPGQRRPSTRDTVELLQGALRERLGMHGAAGLQAGVRIAGSISLAVASAAAIHTWTLNPRHTVLGIVAGAWLAATLALVLLPRLMAPMIAVAWLTTVAATVLAASGADDVIPIAGDRGLLFPGLHPYLFAGEVVCGLIALIAALTVPWRPSLMERTGVGVAVAAATTVTIVASGFGQTRPPEAFLRYAGWMGAVRLLPVVLLIAGLVVVVRHRSTALLWAGLLLLVPAPVTQSLLGTQVHFGEVVWPKGFVDELVAEGPLRVAAGASGIFTAFPWATYGCTLLAAIVVTAVFLADTNRRSALPRDGRSALSALCGLALGAAGGLCTFLLVNAGYRGALEPGGLVAAGAPVVAALTVPWVPLWSRRPMILAALVLAVALSREPDSLLTLGFLIALVLLLLIATADVRGRGRLVGAAAIGAVPLAMWLHWLNLNDLWPYNPRLWQGAAVSAADVIMLLALWWAPVVIIRANRGWAGAVLAFAVGLGWLGFQVHAATNIGALVAALTGVALLVFAARFVVRRAGRRVSDTA